MPPFDEMNYTSFSSEIRIRLTIFVDYLAKYYGITFILPTNHSVSLWSRKR